MTPLPAPRALDQFFLEARSRLLDLAAILDRLGRGDGSVESDARLEKIRKAVALLLDGKGERAERVQQVFSLDYDPDWKKPQPRF
jgi:hypothetical protein